jgi:nucleoside phosphorylase
MDASFDPLYPMLARPDTAAQVGRAVGETGVNFAAALATTATAAGIPVAGWIVAGVAGAAAGTMALVRAVTEATIRRQDAVAWAESLGLADARDVPGFIVKVQGMSRAGRIEEGKRLSRLLAQAEQRQPPWRNDRRIRKLRTQRGVLGTVLVYDAMRLANAMPREHATAVVAGRADPAPDDDPGVAPKPGGVPGWLWAVAAGSAALLFIA